MTKKAMAASIVWLAGAFRSCHESQADGIRKTMNIAQELQQVLTVLNQSGVDYALCGGFALAAYGIVRATVDIDLLISEADLDIVDAALKPLGFTREKQPLRFQQDRLMIIRLLKPDPESEDFIVVDLLLVGELTSNAWKERRTVETSFGKLKVLSPAGLIELKSLRGSGQDLDDIKRLKALE